MKIGLIDVDSHRWPNLCLMKLSACHKAQGDDVEWWTPEGRYDLVYKSRVFTDTYSKDRITVTNADKLVCGGTGYGPGPNLPDAVEHTRPDYGLYPQFPDTAYGFLTRGCPNRCGFNTPVTPSQSMMYLTCSVQEDSPRSVTEIKSGCSSQETALVLSRTSAPDAAACSVSQLSKRTGCCRLFR